MKRVVFQWVDDEFEGKINVGPWNCNFYLVFLSAWWNAGDRGWNRVEGIHETLRYRRESSKNL